MRRIPVVQMAIVTTVILLSGCAPGPGPGVTGPETAPTDPAIDECFTLVNAGRYQEAAGICEQASAANPGSFIAQAAYAEVLRETGNTAGALAHYRKALEIDPSALETRMDLAGLLHEQGDTEPALLEYQEVLKRQPGYLPATIGMANVYRAVRNWSAAAGHFRTATELQPDDQHLRIELVQALADAGRYADAGQAVAGATAAFPDSAGMQSAFGSIFQQKNRFGDAIACYNRAIRLDPNDNAARYNITVCYYADGQLSEARKTLAGYLSREPRSSNGHLLAGQLAMQQNDMAQAEASLRKAIQYDSRNGAAYVMLGNLLHQTGDRDGAKEAYRQALRINPDDPVAKRNLKRLY